MRIRDAFGIYHTIESILRKNPEPKTCVELFDDAEVKKFADSANRVSDYLGHMYRRGLLGRVAAPKTLNSQARWAYFWKETQTSVQPAARPALQVVHVPPITSAPAPQAPVSKSILSKPNIEISDNGGTVVIELSELTITIRTKH